jgi:hypothetical protein
MNRTCKSLKMNEATECGSEHSNNAVASWTATALRRFGNLGERQRAGAVQDAAALTRAHFGSWSGSRSTRNKGLSMKLAAQPSRRRRRTASRRSKEHPAGRRVNSQARTPALQGKGSWAVSQQERNAAARTAVHYLPGTGHHQKTASRRFGRLKEGWPSQCQRG